MKVVSIIVVILGLASLVMGIIFISQAGSAKSKVMDMIIGENAPNFQYKEGKLVPQPDNLIDTGKEIEQSAEALRSYRWAMGKPVNLQNQPQVNFLAFETGLNLATSNLGLARIIQLIGIVNIVLGLAFVLSGLAICRFSVRKT